MIGQIAPQFFSTDLAATLAYYRDRLGFACVGTWQDPPVYAIVVRDGQHIHFRSAAPPALPADKYADELLDAYLRVDDADALHAEFAARGVTFTRPLGDTPWRMRELWWRTATAGCWRSARTTRSAASHARRRAPAY